MKIVMKTKFKFPPPNLGIYEIQKMFCFVSLSGSQLFLQWNCILWKQCWVGLNAWHKQESHLYIRSHRRKTNQNQLYLLHQ